MVLRSTQRQSLVNVHSIVHFKGDIHCDRIQGPRPVTVVPDGNSRALVISQPAVPTLLLNVSQAGIFAFGCVVFFVVMTGAFFFGLATMRDLANKDETLGRSTPS